MTSKQRIDLAQWVVEFARKSGADEATVSINNSREVEIGYRERKLEKLKESTQNGLNLNVYTENRYSGHSTNDLRKEQLKPFIKEAVASTKYLSKDEYRSLPDPKFYASDFKTNLDVFDEKYPSVTSEKRVEVAKEIENLTLEQNDKIISASSGYGDTISESVLVQSNGFVGQRKSTVFSAGVEVTAKDPAGGRPSDWSWGVTRYLNELPDSKFVAEEAVKRAFQKLGQKKIESGKYTMLVENRAASRLLGMLRGPLSARALQQKSSYLDGMLGKKIASEKLTVIDDPFIKRGMGSRHYDGEGLAAKKRKIINKGILESYFIDDYYGKKLGLDPNGGSPSNLVFDYGNRSLEEMMSDIQRGLLITGFIGGNSNSTTGDFSFGIVGQLIENGKVVQALNEMNVSGNAKEFWNQIVEMGNDPYPYSSWRRPSMLFEDVQLSGL